MIQAASHTEAATLVADALGAVGVKVHPPPIPTTPVAAPAVLIQTPEAVEAKGLTPCRWAFQVSVMVVGADTTGRGLLALVDSVAAALAARGLTTTTSPQLYQAPNTPAPLPAVLISGE